MTTTVTTKEDGRDEVSEPYKIPDNNINWMSDVDEKAAIISYQSQLPALIIMKTQKREYVLASFGNIIMGSVYISPNVTQTAYKQFLSNLEMDIKALNPKSIFIAEDFNATSKVSDCNTMEKQASTLDLKLLNTDDIYIEMKWYTDSCNNIGNKNKQKIGKQKAFPRWSYRSLDEEHLAVALIIQDWITPKEDKNKQLKIPPEVKKITQQIIVICNMAMKRVKYKNTEETYRKNAYWWNEEINELRQISIKKRRRFTRANKRKRLEPDIIGKCREEYREAKKQLRIAIRIAKQKWWKALLPDLNEDLWEEDYKIIVRKLKRGAIDNYEILNNKELHIVLGDLFPQEDEMYEKTLKEIYSCPRVIIHEIQTALKRLRRKDPASDPDDMMNRIWNQVISQSKAFYRISIKCWVCRSDSDPKCADPFDNSTVPITDCKQEPDLEHLPGVRPTMCRKIRQKVNGEWRYYRSCAYMGEPGIMGDERFCLMRTGTYNIFMEYCTCNSKDGCNSATYQHGDWLLLLVVGFIAIGRYISFIV